MEQRSRQIPLYQLTRHQIPTHLNVPDRILSFWGIGISVRQLLVLLLGWSAVANAWVRLDWLSRLGPLGVILHLAITIVPAVVALIVAFKQIAGRPLETWLLVYLRYWGQPSVCVWRSVRHESTPYPDQLDSDESGERDARLEAWSDEESE